MEVNVGRMLSNRADLSPGLEGFVGDGYRFTFREVNERVNRIAAYLQDQGVAAGDRVALLCKNSQYFATAFYAAAKAGAITVPLNWRLAAPELSYILNDCGASVLVYDAEFGAAADRLRGDTPVRACIRAGDGGEDPRFEEVILDRPAAEPRAGAGGEEPAIIMYTSGTTGKPKGAVLSHNNLFWASVGITHTIDWRFGDRFLSVAPMFHIGGLAPLVTNIHKGCTTVFMPNFDPGKVWQTIAAEKINLMMSVPMMLAFMLRVPDFNRLDLSSLRFLICGGSAVPESLIRAYHEIGIKVQQVYGITEYSGAVTFWTQDMGMEKCGSMGKPVFHGSVRIVDWNTGRDLLPGEVGEIVCGGPQVFKGYWNNPAATAQVLEDGWYRSGDLGKMDEDGFVYVVDRLKDMIISGGENIYPAELEGVIATHPAVAEVAVVGVPDANWGEIPRAYVVKKPGADLAEEEVIALCRSNLAGYKCVKEVRFVNALPKNAVGKILKKELRE